MAACAMKLYFANTVSTSSKKAHAKSGVAFRKSIRAPTLRVKSSTSVTVSNSAAEAQQWIDNWRSSSQSTDGAAGAQAWIDNWRAEQAPDGAASAQAWIDAWRANQPSDGAASAQGWIDNWRAKQADGAASAQAWIDSWRAKQTPEGAASAQAWIDNWRSKQAAPVPPAPVSTEDIAAEIAARVSERSSWIARWRTKQAAAQRQRTWNAPLLSDEQEKAALDRQLALAMKAEGIEANPEGAEKWGCTDSGASNYDPSKRYDDGSCLYEF
eukprot:CAMPEP_0118932318 /NCGR_PEP_ID=MMETSP1169-20130426/9850_1 /TAXON_ID=36882 /ORGANISM="Pyramimonas obovata, Strain CCMP722" /LENGTH=268 /DNA_ID=CAMNT_0006874957 /DNA_START=99 /DNA_END=905 /DNA_ORIENTATION=+